MEQEDRTKKLAAGKAKLEAFRKKRAKKKKPEGEKAQCLTHPQIQSEIADLSQDGANGIDDRDLANLAEVSDISSVGDSDNNSSLTSGDDWSGEDSELYAAVHYQKKYLAATERIAALEEAVQGKQVALDSLVQEMQSSSPKVGDGRVGEVDPPSSMQGSMPELQDALVQRDKIIRQLTARLQETAALKSNGARTEDPDYMQEAYRLSQQVVMLQQQLAQACETVQQQVSMCQNSVQALQDAKAQILSLQSRVKEKNNHLKQLSLTLDLRSSEVAALKHREAELLQVVAVLQQNELNEENCEIDTALSATSRVNSLEKELERLNSEHAQTLKTMDELKQRLNLSETSRQTLISEKEEAMERIMGLEEDLDQLGQVRDTALQKMFQLECQVHDGSVLLQAEGESHYKANERITELERALAELNAEHSALVAQMTQGQTSVETGPPTDSMEPTPDDLSNLKNVINSQQGELLCLRQQLKSTEDELSTSRDKVAFLQGQLEELQSQQNIDQTDASHAIQQDLDILRRENAYYQQQAALVEEQVQSFKESLKSFSLSGTADKGVVAEIPFSLSELENETDLTKQIQLLHSSYTHLIYHYTQLRKRNQQLETESETSSDTIGDMQHLATVVSQLQEEVEQWKGIVQKKDTELEKVTDQLKEIMKEKEQIASHIQLQEEMVEQRTLQSDTLHRKMESRVNSLFSELTECKEALKESEVANIELQEKLDEKSSEADALKLQLAASEDLMKELQNKASTNDDLQAKTQQAEADLQAALEEIRTLSQLHAHLEDKDLQLQAVQKEKESVEEEAKIKHSKLEEDLKCKQLQMEQILEEHQLALSEHEQRVSSHQEEILRLEENLQHKTSELERMLSQKEAMVEEKQSEEVQQMCIELDKKSHELHMIVTEKEKLLSDREAEVQQIHVQLKEKTEEVEKLMSDLASVKADKETEISVLLSEKTKEAEQVIAEKDHLISMLSSSESERNQHIEHLQQKLDQNNREYQILLAEKEDKESQLVNQQLASDKELKDLHEKLQQKVQECEILWMESEQRWEDLQSHSSIRSKEIQNLKQEQEQQTQKYEILLSDLERLEGDLHSSQSAYGYTEHKNQHRLKEAEAELKSVKAELCVARETASSKDHILKDLHSEVKQLKEQLSLVQITGDEASQERQRALHAVQNHADALEQELDTQKEELATLQSKLAAQADMFKVKEEEMVAENNALNHQLEEVRNAAQETVDQLQRDGDNLREELETAKISLQTREIELSELQEENGKERDIMNTSIAAVMKEKDQLTAKIITLEDSLNEVNKECDARVDSLQEELNRLCEERSQELPRLEKEILQLNEQNTVLQDQFDTCVSEIEQLQQSVKDSEMEQEKLKMDRDRLLQQQDTMQRDFTSQLEHAQSQIAAKDNELQSLEIQRKEASAEFGKGIESLQEELSAVQSELAQKESALITTKEELATANSQLGRLTEEKEMLKNNFDCCMEEMTQRANERDDTIRLLQGQLTEASQNVDRCQDKLREQYESQLTEYEDRLVKADLEVQHLEKIVENASVEKEKIRENFSGQIAEFEAAIQTAESESIRMKEQMSKMTESHEKEIADLKHSHEIQLASVEDNCQSLEKALAKQDSLMHDVSSKFERDGSERDNAYEQQLSDAFEQVRLHEMDVSRLRRQMDEMRRDHQKEQAELQKSLEIQIFDLENKCAVTTSETERLRQSLWGMEQDYTGETQSLQNKILELEALNHSQEKQISALQDKLMNSSQTLDDSVVYLKESHQAEIRHLDELNKSLNGDVENLKEQMKTIEKVHMTEMEALKHQYSQDANGMQERCRQAENYSKVLQSHIDSASESTPDSWILKAEIEQLQHELAASEATISQLQRKLKDAQALSENKILNLTDQVEALTRDKTSKDTLIENLTEDLENEKYLLQESQMICQDLEEKNMHLDSENKSLRSYTTSEETEGRFVSTEEANRVAELKQMMNQLTQEMQQIQAAGAKSRNTEHEENTDVEGGFEPEPDSLEYLDLAVGSNAAEDYFVEETEPATSQADNPVKLRTRSVPSEMFVTADDYLEPPLLSLGPITEIQQPLQTGLVMDSFQPESPISQHPTDTAPNHSFLPLPVPLSVFLEQTEEKSKPVMQLDSCTQTDLMGADSHIQNSPGVPLNVSQHSVIDAEPYREQGDETDVAKCLKSQREQLEEEWVQKMRAQEVELRHTLELEFQELQRQTEYQCQQQIQNIKQETQASFVDAIRKMKKSLEKKHEKKQQVRALKEKLTTKSRKDITGSQKDATDGDEIGEKLRQLHEENQELAEVRDVLLKQIDISQTQGRRYTMQHELQAVISGKFSPSESLKSVSDGDADKTAGEAVIQASESKLCSSAFQRNDNEEDPAGPPTPTVGSDDDGDDRSDGSCARDRFLEELEEMSQQSGQDLPLEWELTSTNVSHSSTSGGTDVFERDPTSSGSVWEVFDGRCLRQDCRELESLKRQYEAEMDALRQQLEVQREHSDHVDHQLRSQYSQAMSSLRQALQDSSHQKELDAVVGQLQELHQRQLQQLNAQHLHDTALQVAAMRVTVEQVQNSRLKLLEEEHRAAVQDMDKQHKEQLNALQARLSSQDGKFPLSASEELTQQYQKLVQKINQSLEKEVLHHLHGDQNGDRGEDEADSNVNGVSTDTISMQQAEAIQHALQAQQEEVLSLRSKLLQEYETMLQQRSEGVSQQTEEVQHLQDEMAQLQEKYQAQIEHFQARIAQYNKEEEQRKAEQQKHEHELQDMKASYEQRITDLENSFSTRISALGQNVGLLPLETVGDGGDSGQQADEDSFELDLSSKFAQARDYVHQTATLTAISDDSDTLDSPRTDPAQASSSLPVSSKVLELQEALRDKTAHLVELEKCLEEERERVSDLTSQLDVESKKLRSLSQQLEQQVEASQALEKSLAEKDKELKQAQEEQAESQKLLQELTEKETETQKEKEELAEKLKQFEEMEDTEGELSTSTPKMEEELEKLKSSLKESTSALWAADTRERTLQEKLAEAEHRHAEALAELQQELEHEAQMERETLESEFKVQLDIELKRQAAELEKRFNEQAGKKTGDSAYISHTTSEADTLCVPDVPHSGEDVQASLTSSQSFASPSKVAQKTVITNSDLTSDHCDESVKPSQEKEMNSSANSEVTKSNESPCVSESVLCVEEESGIKSTPLSATVVTSGAGSSVTPGGANTLSSELVDRQLVEAELRTDFDSRMAELRQEFEAEKAQIVQTHLEKVSELEAHITEAEENYRKLKEDVEEREGAGVETLLKDRYDMELELAKNLMQQEFDDTLQAEKKKFVERHRKLMDDFMSDREAEAEDIKQKHQQELDELRTSLSTLHDTQISSLQAELEQLQTGGGDKENSSSPRESEKLNKLQKQLDEMKERLEATEAEHAEAMAALKEEHNNKTTALKNNHQEQLEAAALDTDVIKSELEQAHRAEVESLQAQLRQWQARGEVSESPREKGALKDVGEMTPEVRSSLEYEETDEEGSVHSFSSLHGKTRSFADVVKSSPPPSSSLEETKVSAQNEDRVKQLEAQVEKLTQLLSQQQPPVEDTMTATLTATTASPPPTSQAEAQGAAAQGATVDAAQLDKSNQSLIAMLQQDLDRISAERNAVQQTNNRLLQLLSDSVHTYVEVEDTINRRLHTVVAASSVARPHTPTLQPRDSHFDLVTPRGAGMASFSSVGGDRGALGGAKAMSSPQSDRSWRQREADTGSPTLEETSILSNATDEGLDISQRLTESIFVGPDIDAEGEEIVSDARGRLQNAVTRLLEMIERTTQQLMEAKATQGDLLDNMATRSRDNSDLATRLHDLEEQVRQEVAAKEYLGLELHKAEGLINGYSSEREALEEQLQALEEQKEVLASELETTRSRLQEFQDATGELEARRQDVERQQSLLQENTGQEVQESTMAGGDATVSEQKALLTEMDSLKQDSRDQTLQLQHRLSTVQRRLQERETTLEEMEKEHQRQVEELRHQTEDLQLQLENTERQLKSNKVFLDEQMAEREQEREEFNKEVEQLKTKLLNKEKQGDTESRLQREIQDLSEQLQARIESQMLMHQQTRELQETLQERDLSAQDLKVWINTLEKELDQRGDTEDELKGRISKLERRLTIGTVEGLSDNSTSPTITPRPSSPNASPLSPTHPVYLRRDSRISLEDELRRTRRSEEELVHEKEALQHTVQEQMLQISALRNQLDEMRHWKGTDLNNTSSSTTTADLRDQLDTERERLEKAEEELSKMKSDWEGLEKELEEKRQEVEQLQQQIQDSATTSQRVKELEEEKTTLQNRIAELSNSGPFPPELLDEKNAEIEELRQQLSKTEAECESLQAQLETKEELVSDLQDTVHSLQRGESCLDVSLSFNEPVPLNASFTERTSLAQELDQSVGEREARINELSAEVEHLTTQLSEQQVQLDQLQKEKTDLEEELRQRDEDLIQLQEEKAQKQEALVEKDSRMEQMLAQVNSLHTEITSLTSFQVELQKDFDTVQSMLDEKEKEIEALTKELLETRSQTEGSDISDLEAELAAVQRQLKEQRNVIDEKEEELYELNEQLETMDTLKKEVQDLKAQLEKDKHSHAEVQQALSEKMEEVEKERKQKQELQQELEEMRLAERAGRGRAHSYPSLSLKPLEEQVQELRAKVFHLENVVKDKEDLIRFLEEEKATEGTLKERDLANIRVQLTAAQDDLADKVTKVAELEQALSNKQEELTSSETQKQQELENLQHLLSKQAQTVQQLELEQQTLQKQAQEHSTEASSLRGEIARLEEELAKSASVATDDVKALQEKLHQAGQRVTDLEQQVTNSQSRLHQTSTQLSEREEQIQQLQTEIQVLQQEARERQRHDFENMSQPKTPESGEDSEAEERLKDVLTRAQHMQTLVKDSLSTSLPVNSREEECSLSRWESEPGLSSVTSPEMAARAQATEGWLRRQQRELAAKNRELAAVRAELETWLRRKDRSAPANEYSASIMTMTLRLQEKDLVITSLKRELKETQELLASVTKSNADDSSSSGSRTLSPQTKQQIAHLRSELRRAKSALRSMQERSGSGSESGDVEYDRERMQKMEAELELFRTSASMSAKDFVKKVQELREELSEEHQRHIREVQDRARQDLEVKLTELQARHNHEMEQALQLQQRRTQEALEQQQQELEKQHKTEINQLRVRHQQEIDRLRSEELASLTDASVAQRLHADISATQQMDQRMLGTLASDMDSDAAGRGRTSILPAQLQALLDRLREAGEHILSVSELDLLQRHLIPGSSDADDALREAREAEKLSLVKTVHALKELLSQADRVNAGLEESSVDWRSDLIHALVEVYRQERLGLEAELHTLRLLQHGQENARTIKNLDNRLHEQARLHQSGMDAMLRAERQSLLTEMEDLQSRLSQLRRELQDLRSQNAETLAQQEENAANKTWKLQREVQVLEYKLQQEKVIEEDLRKGLEAERRRVAELSTEMSHDKGTLISVQSELQSTQLHLSRTKDALEREQNRFTSVTQKHQTETKQLRDALEEEREKNNHLSEKLETLRRQLNSLESGAGRTEAMRKERDSANTRFIKELQAELQAERERLHHMTEKAEEERRQRKQMEAEMEKEQQVTDIVRQELDKLRHQTKKAVDTEAAKLDELKREMQQEKEQTKELQLLLEDRDNSIHHQAVRIQQLLDQVQQLQAKTGSVQQQMDAEQRKADKLAALLESERQQQQTLLFQEQAVAKQLKQDLSQAKADCTEARHHLELEKSRADNLRLEVDRVQSEMRAMTHHVGATERQLESEHSSTWNKLQATQRARDDLQVKVHELEMEMERLQDRLQDLELELDRSRQRELEARHDVERQKLYPSPRSNPNTPRGIGDVQLQSRLNTFCHKLQSVGQRLQTLTLQQRDHNSVTAESGGSDTESGKGTTAVDALMAELQALQKKMAANSDEVDSGNDMEELMEKLEVHQATINQLKTEKEELRRRLQLLEDEDNMRTPRTPRTQTIHKNHQPDGMPQYVSDATTSDDEFLYERTVWASERLNLQMALDTAEREIDHLKKELRTFRGRFNAEGFMVDVDREKMQRLYGKYLRAESFRKALVYQKKYLLLLLGGYQDTEQETLAVIATMGGQPSSTFDLAQRRRHRRLYTIFRSAARTVVAIFRMKYLVRKWRRAVRVGTPVVGGQVSQQFGYVATQSSFTPPNNTDILPPAVSSSTSAHVHTLTRHNSSALANGNVVLTVDAGRRFFTPPTKEISQTAHKTPNASSSSSAARRQLMSELGASSGAAVSPSAAGLGSARAQADSHDDFIQRLENLQSRLSGSGSSHSGEASQQRSSWR